MFLWNSTDVVQAGPLARAMLGIALDDPFNTPAVIFHVGASSFFGWMYHFINLLLYTALHNVMKRASPPSFFSPKLAYKWNRYVDAFKYGSGLDYVLTPPPANQEN